jgi:gliding motility-associated-like protein
LTLLPGISCLWQFGDGSSSTSCGTVSHTYTTEGEFDVTLLVNSSATCSGTTTYNNYIAVKEEPEASFNYLPIPIDIEDTEVSFENLSNYASEYEWTFGDGTATSDLFEPNHSFPEVPNVTYQVRLIAMNDFGCADTIYKPIIVQDVIIFYIPNVFTPDGDDFNEIFKPIMYSGIDVYNYHMTIYNKWGEILFESYNAANGWNGTYGGGEIVQDGVYIWQIEFGDTRSDEIHKYTGHVTILK